MIRIRLAFAGSEFSIIRVSRGTFLNIQSLSNAGLHGPAWIGTGFGEQTPIRHFKQHVDPQVAA